MSERMGYVGHARDDLDLTEAQATRRRGLLLDA